MGMKPVEEYTSKEIVNIAVSDSSFSMSATPNDCNPDKGYDEDHFSSAEPLDEKRSISLRSPRSQLESKIPDENNCSIAGSNRYDLDLWPVEYGESGFGSPYAPTDWPNPGDKWRWSVGNRTTDAGFMKDRFLFPPKHLTSRIPGGKTCYTGIKSLESFIRMVSPNADIDAFFSSFSWKIPSKEHSMGKDENTLSGIHEEMGHELSDSKSKFRSVGHRKSANKRRCLDEVTLSGMRCMEEVGELSASKSKLRSVGHRKSANKRRCLEANSCSEPEEIDCVIISDGSDAFVPKSVSSSKECGSQYEFGIFDEDSSCATTSKISDLVLKPVAPSESGEGLPYAPVDFPNPGDNWRWKVGKRKNANGFMQDRFLFPPKHFNINVCGRRYFANQKVFEDYIRKEFSNANVDAMLSSFSWKIPSKDHVGGKDVLTVPKLNCLDEMGNHCDAGSEFGSRGDMPSVSAVGERRDKRGKKNVEENIDKVNKKVGKLISDEERKGTEKKRRKHEEREMKIYEQDVKKIIKRFPKGVLVDNDSSSPFLTFETTPMNKRVIKTRDLVSVNIAFNKVKKDISKSRKRFRVGEEGTSTPISSTEVGGLAPRQWVTGVIIDWYGSRLGEILKKKAAGGPQQFIICNSYFYPLLAADFMKHEEKLKDDAEYNKVNFVDRSAVFAPNLNKNWTHQISGDVFSPLLIPINHRKNHWALFVVHPIGRTIDIYEPMYREEIVSRSYDEEVNILLVMLAKYNISRNRTFNQEWEKRVRCGIPKQHNNYDCGVLVMAYMDCICREVPIEFDEEKGSEFFRYVIARDLLEDEGMLTV